MKSYFIKIIFYFCQSSFSFCSQPDDEQNRVQNAKEEQKKELLKELKNWEDITVSNAFFTKLKVAEILCWFLTIIHLGNSIVIYELNYENNDGHLDGDISIQLWISTFSIFYLIVMLNVRYVIQYKWMKAKKYIAKHDTFLSTDLWKYMLIESIITQIGPQIFLQNFQISEYNYTYDITFTYELNNLLWVFVWIKCYAILRTILSTNKFTSPRAQRVWTLNGCFASLAFSVKSKFKESANTTLLITYITSSLIAAYMLRIFERPLSNVTGQDYNPFFNSFWNVIITMTTVGYGDLYPKSYGGRILGIMICIWGVILSSLFVVTVSNQLIPTQLEKNALDLIHRLIFRSKLKETAAGAIYSMYRFGKSLKNNFRTNKPKEYKFAEENFKRWFLQYKFKSAEMRKFDNTTEYTFLSKNLIALNEDIAFFKNKQDDLSKQQDEVIEYLEFLIGGHNSQMDFGKLFYLQ